MYPTSTVRYKLIDGNVVLLDLSAGEYVVHNRVASAMWEHLLSCTPEQDGIQKLAQQFDVPRERLEVDLRNFARSCVEGGFLKHDSPSEGERLHFSRARRNASVRRAWWSLFTTSFTLARYGFAYTYQSCLRLPKPIDDDETPGVLSSDAEHAFLQAENFFPLRSAPKDCLPRSLAFYRFMLSIGVAVDHCIGVRRFPFEAHAWVEYRGRVFLNAQEEAASYTELARM